MNAPPEIWLEGAERRSSPNFDHRPPGTTVDLLVIHSISLPPGEFGGPWIEDLFLNRLNPAGHPYFEAIAALRVSAHLLLRRNGALLQFVPLHRRAWHAGVSCFCGVESCNDYSVGVELEGCDTQDFTDLQYRRLAQVTRRIQAIYPAIHSDRIVGHSDIAPGRKTDPGPRFDWGRYRRLLSSLSPLSPDPAPLRP